MALFHDVAGAVFAAPALGCYTQVNLDVLKAFAFTGVLGNGFITYAVANTNNHGRWISCGTGCIVF